VTRLYIQDLFISDYRSPKLGRLMTGLPHGIILSKSNTGHSKGGKGDLQASPSLTLHPLMA
jgi:hypothetical protein